MQIKIGCKNSAVSKANFLEAPVSLSEKALLRPQQIQMRQLDPRVGDNFAMLRSAVRPHFYTISNHVIHGWKSLCSFAFVLFFYELPRSRKLWNIGVGMLWFAGRRHTKTRNWPLPKLPEVNKSSSWTMGPENVGSTYSIWYKKLSRE